MEGNGIFEDIRAFIFGRKRLSPKSRKTLKKYGDNFVVDIQVNRTPIQNEAVFNKLLNLLSNGGWDMVKTKMGYDNLFHLYLLLRLDNDVLIRLEKNTTVEITEFKNNNSNNVESKNVNVAKPIKLNTIIERTEQRMGKKKFLDYDATNNNCQVFITNVLQANHLMVPSLNAFINQDVQGLINEMPNATALRNIMKASTTVSDRLKILQEGSGLRPEIFVKRNLVLF